MANWQWRIELIHPVWALRDSSFLVPRKQTQTVGTDAFYMMGTKKNEASKIWGSVYDARTERDGTESVPRRATPAGDGWLNCLWHTAWLARVAVRHSLPPFLTDACLSCHFVCFSFTIGNSQPNPKITLNQRHRPQLLSPKEKHETCLLSNNKVRS